MLSALWESSHLISHFKSQGKESLRLYDFPQEHTSNKSGRLSNF